MIRKSLMLVVAVLLSGCATAPKKIAATAPKKITVLTLNVENLFDTEDDANKNDETFLPAKTKDNLVYANKCRSQSSGDYRTDECLATDWNKNTLDRKMRRLADVVEQVGNGAGPDILFLQEVENENVLKMWRDKYLKHMNYQTLSLIEGPDERGIDTALLSRLPQSATAQLHLMDYSKNPEIKPEDIRPTRGILENRLTLPDGTVVAVFTVHFPSQGAPTIHRKIAVQTLLDVTAKVPAGMPIIVGGDFNITNKEEWKEKYFKDMLSPKFSVSHFVGCKDCAGTTYYHKERSWSFFDVLLFSNDLDTANVGGWKLSRPSVHLINSSIFQINRFGSPARFGDGNDTYGVTDHWPMYAELNLSTEPTQGVTK